MEVRYKELDLNNEKDKKTMDRIISFDTTKDCFGDYDFYSVSKDYINLAIYIKNKLIGYLGFAYTNNKDSTKYTITICIREEYQSLGIGNIVLKQAINTLFNEYNATSITMEAIESNDKCIKLIEKNHFSKLKEDTFLKDGEYVKSNVYVYKKRDYKKYLEHLRKYNKIN